MKNILNGLLNAGVLNNVCPTKSSFTAVTQTVWVNKIILIKIIVEMLKCFL